MIPRFVAKRNVCVQDDVFPRKKVVLSSSIAIWTSQSWMSFMLHLQRCWLLTGAF